MLLRSDIDFQEDNLREERAKNSILGKNFSEEQPFRRMGVHGCKMATLFVAIPQNVDFKLAIAIPHSTELESSIAILPTPVLHKSILPSLL